MCVACVPDTLACTPSTISRCLYMCPPGAADTRTTSAATRAATDSGMVARHKVFRLQSLLETRRSWSVVEVPQWRSPTEATECTVGTCSASCTPAELANQVCDTHLRVATRSLTTRPQHQSSRPIESLVTTSNVCERSKRHVSIVCTPRRSCATPQTRRGTLNCLKRSKCQMS
jgi:hypothetical protein